MDSTFAWLVRAAHSARSAAIGAAPAPVAPTPSPHAPHGSMVGSVVLPVPPAGADLALGAPRWRWIVLVFSLTFLIYAAFVPRFVLYSSPPTGDQPFYLMETASLARDGDMNLSNNYARRDYDLFYGRAPHPPGFVGMSAPYPLPKQLAQSTARPPDEQYNFHPPGLPLVLVPAWIVGSWLSLWWPATIVFMCLVGALTATNVFLLAYEVSGRQRVAWAVWAPLALSGPLMTYAYLLFTELPSALLLIYAFRRLALGWRANSPLRMLAIGLCIGYLPWLNPVCLAIAVPLFAFAAIQWRRAPVRVDADGDGDEWQSSGILPARDGDQPAGRPDSRTWGIRPALSVGPAGSRRSQEIRRALRQLMGPAGAALGRLRLPARPDLSLGLLVAPIAISAALMIRYNLFLFGTPFALQSAPELGSAPNFVWPWQGIGELTEFVTAGFGLLFDRNMGLLVYAPIYVLSGAGLIALSRSPRRADRRLLLWLALVTAPYVVTIMAYVLWNGIWCPPARYLLRVAPLAAAPLALSLVALSRSVVYRALYAALALIGLVFMAFMLYDARLMWPYPQVFSWLAGAPELPVHVDLRDVLPAFNPLDDVRLPRNLALVSVAALATILCGHVLLRRWGWPPRGSTSAGLRFGASWLGVATMVGVGWYVTDRDYLKRHTLLTEVRSWTLSAPARQPEGIAYLAGKVYLTDLQSGAVGAFDVATGAYHPLKLAGGHGAPSFARPADVVTGPHGLLYVLNNGIGRDALLALRPDGAVVRDISLDGRSTLSLGLAVAPSGALYLGDTVGGHVLTYGPGGGAVRAAWGGANGTFNNVVGVALGPRGSLYAAESSASRVQQLDAAGHVRRVYNLTCQPRYMAMRGDWIDITCDTRIISLDVATGDVQASRLAEGDAPLAAPTGLIYGNDGLLYVRDGSALVAYRVQH